MIHLTNGEWVAGAAFLLSLLLFRVRDSLERQKAHNKAAMLPACCAICPPGAAWFGRIAALKDLLSLLT
jgi:hypothetical protein